VQHPGQPLGQPSPVRQHVGAAPPVLRLDLRVEALHQVLLGREVVVRVAGGQPGILRDRAHRGPVVPVLAEHAQRGVHDELPGTGPPLGIFTRHGHLS
jgi:hypothetical protein